MEKDFYVIFDNGGGITLQVGDNGFVHHYDDPAHAAQDVKEYLNSGTTADWEGDEPEARLEYSYEDVRNGGHHWQSRRAVEAALKSGKLYGYSFGHNMTEFYRALGLTVTE